MPTPDEITTFLDDTPPPGRSPWVDGAGPSLDVTVVEPDPAWPSVFETIAERVRVALGSQVLELEHIGSTAVPGLPAKPVIDIDLVVADVEDEAAYVAPLEAVGFVLRVREPWWYGHRLLRLDDPRCHLHVSGPDSALAARHRIFRDWLRAHPDDAERYAAAKRRASDVTVRDGGHGMDYNRQKQDVVREIYDRAFRGLGLVE